MNSILTPDPTNLYKIKNSKMPFGKYAGVSLIDLPDDYVEWFFENAIRDNDFGRLMTELREIKLNGLEPLIRKL